MTIPSDSDKSSNKDFLGSGSQLPNPVFHTEESPLESPVYTEFTGPLPEHIQDIKNFTKTELSEKYWSEYNSHKNMKSRCKKQGYILAPIFNSFSNFLSVMGRKYHPNYTLDRIDNDNPNYSPDNVEWRDKYAQNSNKSNNVYLTHDDGRRHTIAQWANITKQKADTLYKRHSSGWTDMEIITGEKVKTFSALFKNTPWPYDNRKNWERAYQKELITGRNMTRMEFLNKQSKKIYNRLIQQDIDPWLAYNEEEEIVNPAFEENMKKIAHYRWIIKETDNQLRYESLKKRAIKSVNGKATPLEMGLFNSINPRPPYTVNMQQS